MPKNRGDSFFDSRGSSLHIFKKKLKTNVEYALTDILSVVFNYM